MDEHPLLAMTRTRLCLILIAPLALLCYVWDGLRIGGRIFLRDWRAEWLK